MGTREGNGVEVMFAPGAVVLLSLFLSLEHEFRSGIVTIAARRIVTVGGMVWMDHEVKVSDLRRADPTLLSPRPNSSHIRRL